MHDFNIALHMIFNKRYLSGEYGAAYVDGMEHDPDDPKHILASSCCKHFVANSVEMSTEDALTWNRFEINAEVTDQDLIDSYMPAFQACVEKGRTSGLSKLIVVLSPSQSKLSYLPLRAFHILEAV